MKILFAGTPAIAVEVLDALVSSGHEIVGVLTREQAPVGRKKVLTASAVSQRGLELGLPVIEANTISTGVRSLITSLGADLAVVVAYGVILDKATLDSIPRGWFNLHFSILPRWRGAAPVQRAIAAGDTETGVTLFRLDEGMDTGPIVGIAPAIIHPNESADDLLARLAKVGISLLNAELPSIYADTVKLNEQRGNPSFAKKVSRADAKLDFSLSARTLANVTRAMNSEPMAWCELGADSLRIIHAHEYLGRAEYSNMLGEVFKIDGRILVNCGDSSLLELLTVQPSSKNVMSAMEWFNGKSGQVVLT